MQHIVNAFYKFVHLPDFKDLKDPLQTCCEQASLVGSILLAEEGINGTVGGPQDGLDAMWQFLKTDPRFADIVPKSAVATCETFNRMKVRLKREIVSLGVESVDPTHEVGTYVKPDDWNALINEPDVLVIDTRNQYEVDVGTFKGALNPLTDSFRDFPEFVAQQLDPETHPKVAMFCTGGIRCEKATSYMLQKGFKEVYHLEGGILKYLETVSPDDSQWEGECFVFDQRVTVDHKLDHGNYTICHACRHPLRQDECDSPVYEQGVRCPYCADSIDEDRRERAREREHQMQLARERQVYHMGHRAGQPRVTQDGDPL
jgi:UPF0176 protein